MLHKTKGFLYSKSWDTLVVKRDNFSLYQCPKENLEIQEIEKILYASTIETLMYGQVCTHPNIAYIVRVLGRYLSALEIDHWKATNKVMRYLYRTRDFVIFCSHTRSQIRWRSLGVLTQILQDAKIV